MRKIIGRIEGDADKQVRPRDYFCDDRYRSVFVVDVFDEAGKFAADQRPGYHNGRYDIEQLSRREH